MKKTTVFSVFLFLAASLTAAADETTLYADYRVDLTIDTQSPGEVRFFRLPVAQTEKFLSVFSAAAEHLGPCDAFERKAMNPLLRRQLGVKISNTPLGCVVQIDEYSVWQHACTFPEAERAELSSVWKKKSSGAGLGGWTKVENELLKNFCETSPVQ